MRKQASGVRIESDGDWDWLSSSQPCDYVITGKYLFFSVDRKRLIDVGTHEIVHHQFHEAKVNAKLQGENKEYVLCLYYKDDSRKYELADRCRSDYPDVKYRYWKSDVSTRHGEYSQVFLSKLDAKERREFTAPKEIIESRNAKDQIIPRQVVSRKVTRERKRKTNSKDG